MHQNALKNLPAPVESGDAVNKLYMDDIVAQKYQVHIIRWEAED
jgi:hypothetical protein